MSDVLADSSALLERLIAQIVKEKDPAKYDQLATEIWRVLEEREHLRSVQLLKKKLDQKESPRFGTD